MRSSPAKCCLPLLWNPRGRSRASPKRTLLWSFSAITGLYNRASCTFMTSGSINLPSANELISSPTNQYSVAVMPTNQHAVAVTNHHSVIPASRWIYMKKPVVLWGLVGPPDKNKMIIGMKKPVSFLALAFSSKLKLGKLCKLSGVRYCGS